MMASVLVAVSVIAGVLIMVAVILLILLLKQRADKRRLYCPVSVSYIERMCCVACMITALVASVYLSV